MPRPLVDPDVCSTHLFVSLHSRCSLLGEISLCGFPFLEGLDTSLFGDQWWPLKATMNTVVLKHYESHYVNTISLHYLKILQSPKNKTSKKCHLRANEPLVSEEQTFAELQKQQLGSRVPCWFSQERPENQKEQSCIVMFYFFKTMVHNTFSLFFFLWLVLSIFVCGGFMLLCHVFFLFWWWV